MPHNVSVIERYFDHAATTPLAPEVAAAIRDAEALYGNPHSLHSAGRAAMAAVENARDQVAGLLGAEDPSQIVFTSGATEGNNWILRSFGEGDVGPFEHSSVREPAERLGFSVLANEDFRVEPARTPFASHMLVNNETGTLFDLASIRGSATTFHSDVTQALGKLPIPLDGIDIATFSAHKLYGPKGIGAVYLKDPTLPLEPLLLGGAQENGLRAGTLNVPGIVGFGAAAALAQARMEEDFLHAQRLREVLLEEIERVPEHRVIGGGQVSPYILSLSFHGVQGETVVHEVDREGYAISSGAACSSRSTEPSHVLTALRLPDPWLRGTIRISFGRGNTVESTAGLARALTRTVSNLRMMLGSAD